MYIYSIFFTLLWRYALFLWTDNFIVVLEEKHGWALSPPRSKFAISISQIYLFDRMSYKSPFIVFGNSSRKTNYWTLLNAGAVYYWHEFFYISKCFWWQVHHCKGKLYTYQNLGWVPRPPPPPGLGLRPDDVFYSILLILGRSNLSRQQMCFHITCLYLINNV